MMSEDSSAAGTDNRPPMLEAAFMANLSSNSSQINKVRTFNDTIFETVSHSLSPKVPHDEHLDSDDDEVLEDYTIPYDQYLATKDSQDVPTEASPDPPSAIPPSAAYMLNTLSELTTQVEGHRKVNQKQALVNATLTAELDRCKLELARLEHNKVKLENDQVILARNKQNAELKQETESLKTTLRNKEATIAHLTCETKTVLSEKKTLEDKYLEEIVCLKSANQVATGLLQKFQMPTQTIPMLSKKPMIASSDIHKIGLGFSNPWYGRKAQLSQPTLYDGHRLLQPGHARVTVHEFVPQKELSREQAYWLSATDIASLTSDPPKPVTPFVRTSPTKSQVQDQLCIAKDICSIVLASVNVVPHISDCMCAELRSSCDREHNRVLELEAEISKHKRLITESEKHFAFLEQNYVSLQLKFQNYKGMKPAAGVSKTQSKNDNQKSRVLPSKNVSTRRIEDHPRNLNKKKNVNSSLYVKRFGYVSNKNAVCGACDKCLVSFNHDSFLVINVPSMNTIHAKKPQVARPKTTPKYIKKTDITVAPRIVPQWKPTGRQFLLYDIFGLKKSLTPISKPLELSPSVSSSSPTTVISRFSVCQLSDRKASSKGISDLFA
ncbi:hypothetical protein Tco_1418082 [Tanacetum coccineum]